jgi:hypothetical protein
MNVRPLVFARDRRGLVSGGCSTEQAARIETPTSAATRLPEDGLLQPEMNTLNNTRMNYFDLVRITFTVPSGWEAWDNGVLKDKPGAEPLGVGFWDVGSVPPILATSNAEGPRCAGCRIISPRQR